MNDINLKIGAKVMHPVHGECRITFVGDEYVGVEFDEGTNALLKKESFKDKPKKGKVESLPWPESTFIEEDGCEHYIGEKFKPFYDDLNSILRMLPEIIPHSHEAYTVGSKHITQPHGLPDDWANASILQWPVAKGGLSFIIKKEAAGNMLIRIFPFYSFGTQTRLELRRVVVWENKVEAQIEADWGYSPVAFYDSQFVYNRIWYEAEREYEFILAGIAYMAQPAIITEMPFKPNPDEVKWQRKISKEKGLPEPEIPDKIKLENMAILIPMKNGDIDEYQFRGKIRSVEKLDSEILGQSGYIADVTVMKFDDNDERALKILITEKIWAGEKPPESGNEIEGFLWLQGYLWYDYRMIRL